MTPPKAKAALEANIEQARFSKQLATIVCDVPLNDFTIQPYAPTHADWQRVRNLFHELEFKSLLGRIPNAAKSRRRRRTILQSGTRHAGSHVQRGRHRDPVAGGVGGRAGCRTQERTAGIRFETDGEPPMRACLTGTGLRALEGSELLRAGSGDGRR